MTAYEMRISDWSSDVCSSDLGISAGMLKSDVLRRGQERPSTCLFQGQPEELRGPRRSMRLVPAHGYVRRARPDRPVQAPAGSAPRGLHVLRKGCSGGCCQSWAPPRKRSAEHTSALQSLMRLSSAVFCLQKNTQTNPL